MFENTEAVTFLLLSFFLPRNISTVRAK